MAQTVQKKTATGVSLNIVPVEIDDADVRVGVLPFTSRDQLRQLRVDHANSHLFLRRGDAIHCVPRVGDAADVGDQFETIPLCDDLGLVANLFRNALIDYLRSLDRRVYGHFPVEFVGTDSKHNHLAASVPAGIDCPEWLAVRRLHEADVRVFTFDKQPAFVGVAFDVRTKRYIDATCKELIEMGLSLRGHYVCKRERHNDERLEPISKLVGRVTGIDASTLMLDDNRPEVPSIEAHDAFLHSGLNSFDACMLLAFGNDAPRVRERLEQRLAHERSGPQRLSAIRKLADHFADQSLELMPGVFAKADVVLDATNRRCPRLFTAPKPVYVLDPTGAQTNTWHDGGLQRHGPYSRQTFSKNRPRVCVVCQTSAKGRVEQFLQKFLHGVRHPKKQHGPFDNGLIGKYRLDDVDLFFFCADGDTATDYRRAAQQAIERSTDNNEKWDLALVQIDKSFRERPFSDNPYLVTKQELLTHQVPVQEFTLELSDMWDGQLAYALNNMALATYSKLGGIPWLVQCDKAIAHELVIGLGSANIGEGRLGERERVVGITTVFTGDGNYRLSNKSQAVPFSEYADVLLESLRTTITTIAEDMNWQAGDDVRLIFHAFKPFKNVEVEAVKSLMAELGDYDTEFAFVEVVEHHPYLIFDQGQTGAYDYNTRSTKGVFAPERGRVLRLSNREVLIVLTGARDIKRPEHGMPRPVLLRLHPASTFKDTTYIARQAYTFAAHSWRSFFPSPLPVTVLYSELIAGLLGQLGQLKEWSPTVMLGRIGRSRWFL